MSARSDARALKDNRLVKAFAALRREGRKTLLPFLTAGYPNLDATRAILHEMEARGVRICELGVPFSDPVADGPTIQASYTDALAAGVTSDKILEAVAHYRRDGGEMALLAMVSYSIVFRHGVESWLRSARAAGLDGVIIPDLPLDESSSFQPLAVSHGLCSVMLIAPTTPPDRRLAIARASRGFIYYVSVAGITGERVALPAATVAAVGELRTHTDTPVCVGFGISSPDMVKAVCQTADGAIVGSAIVHRISDAKALAPDPLARKVGDFVAELLAPLV
ncbi:MAG: tryptophan synthase subunit alpha [Planctomycetota bacterium]|nr:tryptophan synthase subunit alpha [Planctomycetota bacterium]